MSFETLYSNRITHVSQDGNREFLNLLVSIYTDENALLSALIYKEDFKTL